MLLNFDRFSKGPAELLTPNASLWSRPPTDRETLTVPIPMVQEIPNK